jgi:hypothetical protein
LQHAILRGGSLYRLRHILLPIVPGEKVASEFVISGGDTAEIFQSAETSLDDIVPFVGALVEAVEG